jgi:triosephosphate isomerase (TIM)
MRTPLIAGNWKMFKTLAEATTLVEELAPLVSSVNNVEIVVAPVFTAISAVAKVAENTAIKVAAQDCFWEEEGAFTGEISPKLLKDAGCSYVIIGHSERRQYFGETDETVNRKSKAALKVGLVVLMCVGETLDERESNATFKVIETQIKGGLSGIPTVDLMNIVIAYEPVWAIGTGKTASDEQAQEVHAFIRSLIEQMYSSNEAQAIRILYGGSVKPENVKGLMSQADIDGALVGGASLKAELFAGIVCFKG